MNAEKLFVLTEEEDLLKHQLPEMLDPIRKIAEETKTIFHFDKQWSDKAWNFFRESGFTGFGIPDLYGGVGWSSRAMIIFNEELSAIDAALGLSLGATISLVALSILAWGTDEQKSRWLHLFASGQIKGCYMQTEIEIGSNVAGILGTAVKENGVWRITKDCVFITNGAESKETGADVGLALARTAAKPGDRHYGLTMFIVDLNRARREGTYLFGRIEEKAGLHLSATATFKLERAVAEDILGEENHGWDVAMSTLVGSRATAIPSQALGVIRGARDKAREYMERRIQFLPLDKIPILRSKMLRVDSALHASRLLSWRAALYKDEMGVKQWREWECEASQAKLFAGDAAKWAPSSAMQMMGGVGYMMKDGVGKYWHDGRIINIYEGTKEIQEIIVMRRLLKRLGMKNLWLLGARNKFSFATRHTAACWLALVWPVFSSGWSTEEKEFSFAMRNVQWHNRELYGAYRKLIEQRYGFLMELGKTLQKFPPDPKGDTFPSPYFKLAYVFAALEGAKLALWEAAFRVQHKGEALGAYDIALAQDALGFASELLATSRKSRENLSSSPSLRKEIEGKGMLKAEKLTK
ncbi:acyl-CoA dehydrogenase family protein [Patescibacteria group bacterium]|nr:acyl-CoA dehydrogenase family protein [Patescibacteria group bacterium]